jgi:Tol biopolymer transport system component
MIRTTLALALLLTVPVLAQGPSADWRTVETPHFRVHYPREYEAWSLRAAERLESIRDAVSQEVGFTPTQTIDVLVINPVADANGVAWPFLDTPRMIFYAEPPGPDEQLGAFGHWIDILAVHETAHLVHMLRPTRNPFGHFIERFGLPLNPITLRAPRWVLEGYATVVEGRLTGAGRPTSTIRALILRRWAENGRLPSYGQLNSDQRFLGMSMAYLMGSAYLEWLEQRSGPGSLRNLWSRMTAREKRSFEQAFTGVFGDRPDRLYGRFVAELTASALTVERGTELREGVLFQETPRASGDPAVSPDGAQLAVVIRDREKPQQLVVWSTGAAEEEQKKYEERVEKMLARDPEDVRAILARPLPRKAVHSLVLPDGGDIDGPRWTRDGKSLVFAHRVPDAEGFLHFDLYRWDFETLTRITHLADVRDADPLPDGRTAIALRSRYGASQLVTVDLTTGAVTPREEASIDQVVTHPRVSPDGTRTAYVAHRGGRWTLFVNDAAVTVPGDPASPEWLSNDELLVTVFARGFAELYRVKLDGTSTPVTRTAGGAFDGAPSPDGRLFFMSLDPDGYVVRLLDAMQPAPVPPLLDAALVPAIPPAALSAPPTFVAQPVTPHAYGVGRQELGWFASTNFAPDQQAFELGVRFGDVVGRLDTLIIGSLGRDDSPEGGAIATAWRGWPVELLAHAFTTDGENGLEVRGLWSRRFPQSRLTLEAGALSDDLLFGSAAFSTRQVLGASSLDETVRVDLDDDHYRGIASLAYRTGTFRIAGRYQHDGGTRVTLGGLPSSILPRSAYAHRVLDPSLPVAARAGEDYDGWRIESTVPGVPLTAFYQRHTLDGASLSLAGAQLEFHTDPDPVLKFPALDLTLGVARVLDEPLRGDTQWWLGMRWRP